MITKNVIQEKLSTDSDLDTATRDFVKELTQTDHYMKYENASKKFQVDTKAQKALHEYQAKASDLQTKQMFNNINSSEQQDLERLWIAFLGIESVQEFFDAQGDFQALCRACAQVISDNCGLDYATSCGSSCCG